MEKLQHAKDLLRQCKWSSFARVTKEDSGQALVELKAEGMDLPQEKWADVTTSHFRTILRETTPLDEELDTEVYGWHPEAPTITQDQVLQALEK